MTNINTIQMLARYNAWTNDLIFEAIDKLINDESNKKDIIILNKMVRALNHNYTVDLIWQAHLQKRNHGIIERNPTVHPPFNALANKQQEMSKWYISWSDDLTDSALNEKINVKLIGGNEVIMSCEEIFLHVVNHTTYHRGFIAELFFQMQLKPPATDLTVFLRNK